MDIRNDENLKELFERFVDAAEAERAAEDIEKGEQLFRDNPVVEPGVEVISSIKAEVNRAVVGRRARHLRRTVYELVAAAAVVVIAVAVGHRFFTQDGPVEVPQVSVWASEDVALETLTAEVDALESELFAVQFGESGTNGFDELSELEMEIIEVSSGFWKG